MESPAVTPNIPGLPPGAVLKPLDTSTVQGLPPGAVVKPVGGAAPPASGSKDIEPPIPDSEKGSAAGLRRTLVNTLSLPGNIISAFKEDAKPEEALSAAMIAKQYGIPETVALAMHRLVLAPMAKEHELANAYQKVADSQGGAEEFGSPGTTGHPLWDQTLGRFIDIGGKKNEKASEAQHMANLHRVAGIVPLVGPWADQLTQHFLQGDPSGAVSELLSSIALGKALDVAGKGAARQVAKIAPRTATIAGEEVPVMAGQEKNAAPIARKVAADPSLQIEDAQQAGAAQGVKNVATDALNRQLQKVSTAGAKEPLQLPAPEGGGEPFVFTIPGNVPEEVLTGKSVVPAKRVYAGTEDVPIETEPASGGPNANVQRQELGSTAETIPESVKGTPTSAQARAQQLGPSAAAVPERSIAGPSSAKQIKWQYLTSGAEEGESSAARGQGTLHTADPQAAQDTLSALKALQQEKPSPEIQNAIDSLEGQLKQYHAYDNALPASARPRVPQTGTASSFRDAAEQVKAAAQPTFRRLDQLSDGAFSTYQNTIEKSRAAMRRATTVEDMDAAEAKMKEAEGKINDLMQTHAAQFQPNELRNAQSAWRDMQTMNSIHSYVEKAFSAPESVASKSNLVKRTLDGNKLISNLNQMVEKIPAEDLQRVLGPDGINSLYELGQLTSKPEAAANLNTIVQEVAGKLVKGGGAGAIANKVAGPKAGIVVGTGIAAKDAVLRAIATKPRVAALAVKALKFGTPAKIYGPLIASEISKSNTGDEDTEQK